MTPRTILGSALSLAVILGCGGKKSPPAGGSGTSSGTADAAVTLDAPVAVAPPKDLPPLAADPGGNTGTVEKVVSFGGPRTDSPRGLAVAPDGGVIVSGYFEDAAKFGALTVTSVGKSDAYAARIERDGTFTWVRPIGSVNEDVGDTVAVAPDGTIAVGGLFSAKVAVGKLEATAEGSDDLFVAGLGPDGTPRWLWTAGGPGSDAVTAMAATPDGGFIVGVSWLATARFGAQELTALAYDDAALVKLSAGGDVQWVRRISGEGSESVRRIAVDGNGDIYVLGTFQQTIDVGGGPLTSAGAMDLLIAGFDSNGNHRWSQRVGNPWNEVAGGLAVDRAGNLVLTGSFDRDVDFLGTPIVSAGESDIVVARLTRDGKPQWVKRFGSQREDIGYGIATDDAGNLLLTGWFENPIKFGGSALTAHGQKDGFIAKLAPDGAHLWSTSFGDWDNDAGNAIAVAPDGAVWLTGIFRYALGLGTEAITSIQVPGAKVQFSDSFVARFAR